MNHIHNCKDIISFPFRTYLWVPMPKEEFNIQTTLIACYKSVNVTLKITFTEQKSFRDLELGWHSPWCRLSWSYLWFHGCLKTSGEFKSWSSRDRLRLEHLLWTSQSHHYCCTLLTIALLLQQVGSGELMLTNSVSLLSICYTLVMQLLKLEHVSTIMIPYMYFVLEIDNCPNLLLLFSVKKQLITKTNWHKKKILVGLMGILCFTAPSLKSNTGLGTDSCPSPLSWLSHSVNK